MQGANTPISALAPQKKLASPILTFAIAQLRDIQVLHFPNVNIKCIEIGHYPHLFWSCHGGSLDLLLVGLHLLALLLGRLLLAQPAVPPTLRVIALFRLLACRRLRGTSDRSSRTKCYRDWLLFPIKVILTGVLERRSKKLLLCMELFESNMEHGI